MAVKKKRKPKKAKAGKKAKRPAVKKVKKSKAKKKVARKATKPAAKKSTASASTAAKPMPAAPAVPSGERIGIVTHYFGDLSVAIIRVETGVLRVGDMLHIKGHTTDFRQNVESLEVDHMRVESAFAGQSVGLRVKEHAREHDVVYKLPM